MTNDYYTKNHNLHNTYGGKIYYGDFNGYISIADIAERIAYDQKFDKQCHRNADNRHIAKIIDNYKQQRKER